MAAIGIDLGTTYSRVAVLKDGRIEIITNDHGNRATPSCVAFTDVERLVGDAAMNQIASNPCNTVFDAKRLIGRRFREVMVQGDLKLWTFNVIKDPNHDIPNVEVTFRGQKKLFTAEEISSMVLMKMKEVAEAYIGQKVNDAVIAVPAYFNDSQRQSTKDAATIAGLNVLRLINEPTAVAVTFDHCVARRSENAGKKMVLIFDLGGGTFDASLLSIDDEGSTFEVKAVAGDTHLGGNDFDNNLMSYCIEVFRNKQNMDITRNKKALGRLRAACEKAKRILSSATKTIIELEGLHEAVDFSLQVTRANFEDLNLSVFAKCIKIVDACLAYAKMDKTSVHEVILVGGSTRIPKLQHMIKTFFDGKELCKRINPDEAVAYGAAVTAAMLSGVKSMILKKLVILDVTPLAVVVEEPGKTMSVVIPRNTLLPSKFTYNRSITTRNNHAFLKFTVYQGQHARFTDNYLLGQFSVSGIPLNNRGVSVAEICFEIDANGILTVTSTHVGLTDKTKSLTVADHRDRLSKQEIEKKIKDAKKLKVEDQEYLDYKKKADAFKDIEDCLFTLKKKLEGDYINQEVLKNMKYLYDDTTKWFAENKAASCDKIKARKEYLEFVCTLAFTKSCPCVSPLGNT